MDYQKCGTEGRDQPLSELNTTVDPNLDNYIDPHSLKEVSFSDIARSLNHFEGQEAVLQILGKLFGTNGSVDGLGFEVTELDSLSAAEREELRSKLTEALQNDMSWDTRLRSATILTLLNTAHKDSSHSTTLTSDRVAKYFKQHAQPGDIVYFGQGGSGSPAFSELFEVVTRRAFARAPGDEAFPFSHIGIVVGENEILHITPYGPKIRSWDRMLIEKNRYDAVAIGRTGLAPEERLRLADAARKLTEGKRYNADWIPMNLLQFPWGRDRDMVDRSVQRDEMVCIDVVTEAVRQLRKEGSPLSSELEQSLSPLDLFAAPDVRIVAAAAIERDYDLW